jgi:hypothetical protein
VDKYRASECCVPIGSYCTWFQKAPLSLYDPEIIFLVWGLSLLCHENFGARISSGAFPVHCLQNVTHFYIHSVQFCSPTVIPCSYTVPKSYLTVLQLYNHTLQLYISTVEPCRYTVTQSYTAGWQLCRNEHLHLSTVIHCSYTVLQSSHAVTHFHSHYMHLHSSTIITCSYAVLSHYK